MGCVALSVCALNREQYCVSSKPTHVPFDAHQAAVQPYPITTYQPLYFVAESFADATDKVR